MIRLMTSSLAVALVLAGNSWAAAPRVLLSNGPLITNATGGTGPILGQPLSKAETFTLPSGTVVQPPTGYGATHSANTSIADDFFVPDGGWDLDQITLYAYQAYPTNATSFGQTITRAYINLWDTLPVNANTPDLPPGTPIPQPLLAQPLEFDVTGKGVFVAHRTSGSTTKQPAPIYSFTVSADGLPNSGKLDAGHYWLEFSFDGQGASSNFVFVPQVTPRSAVATNFNARQYNVTQTGAPVSWFEAREAYQSAAQPGRGIALPFDLIGTPEPATLLTLGVALPLLTRRRPVR